MNTQAKPLVSIIMPFYNRAKIIRATVDSVLQQTYRNFELICVDDGSTDEVPAILAEYAAKDARVKIITKTHTNPGDARNLGYNQSVGDYILFLDSDDLYHVSFVEKMLSTMQKENADLVMCGCQRFDHMKGLSLTTLQKPLGKIIPKKKLERTAILQQVFDLGCAVWRRMFHRQIIDQYQIQFQSLPCAEDHLFIFDYTLHCQQVVIFNETLVWHRINNMESVSDLKNVTVDPYSYCQAMEAVRACIPQEAWHHVQHAFQYFYFGETCYAIVRSNYQQGKRIFQYARRQLQPIKDIKIDLCSKKKYRIKAQKLYRFCLLTNQYWLFALAKRMALKILKGGHHHEG